MGDYAAKLSQLLRRCYHDKIEPIMLTDGDFTDYITELREEKSLINPGTRKRTEDTISDIGRVWLDFLSFVGRLHGYQDFVAPEGRIRVMEKTYNTVDRSGRKLSRSYLVHHSFGPPSRKKKRNPITVEQIALLKDTARKEKTSNFVKARRSLLIDLLTDTGARRSEIEQITIDDIKAAKRLEKNPTLRLTTLKQHGELSFREVPVLPTLLHLLNNHIERQRNNIMKKKYKEGNDHRRFFVSERTGRPLTSKTLYNEIKILKAASGIEPPIFPHMFRHRFITKLFIDLIRTHQVTNEDEFRRNLLNTEIFKAEVTEWTGHLDPDSINDYLHLALAASADYADTVNTVHMQRAMDAYFEREAELTRRLDEGLSVEDYKKEMKLLKELVQKDFEVARTREASVKSKRL